jgi:tRNA-splicing ligase RtcB
VSGPTIITHHGGRPIRAWVGTKTTEEEYGRGCPPNIVEVPDIEESALAQLVNVSKLPFLHSKGIAVMPDVHAGIGATVGSVIPTTRAIIPAAVGVDIGCGMNAVRLSLTASDLDAGLLNTLYGSIMRGVPVGMASHGQQKTEANEQRMTKAFMFEHAFLNVVRPTVGDRAAHKAASQLGSLGGGNHFIEISLDESQAVWVVLHSGSRGIGNQIGSAFIERAQEQCDKWFVQLPHKDLAFFPEDTDGFRDYIAAVLWAQNYAFMNRAVMMEEVLRNMRHHITKPFEVTQEAINCHHNYVERENHYGQNVWVTRKGAIRAREGDLGIIPGSMGARSFIVRGKGNPESYCSCSHGAGRKMTRTAAEKMFTVADVIAQTEGVVCAKDDSVLDEIPGAYKDIDKVMELQSDLVEVVHTLKQVMCIKGPKEGKKWGKKKAHQ